MKYMCDICGWEYDEAKGYPKGGIAPGNVWENAPEDFQCPLCKVGRTCSQKRKYVESPGEYDPGAVCGYTGSTNRLFCMEIAAGAEIRYVEYVESVNSRGKYLKTYFLHHRLPEKIPTK